MELKLAKYKCIVIVMVTSVLLFLATFIRYSDRIKYHDVSKTIEANPTRTITTTTTNKTNKQQENLKPDETTKTHDHTSMKYILQWTSDKTSPFVYMGVGQEGFISQNCPYTNCYVTHNRTLLKDYTEFDVIAFVSTEVNYVNLPERRSPHQKYVFGGIESAANYPICDKRFDGFFNWTWTYKLDSDSRWGYIVIRDTKQNIIGPNKIMHWLKPSQMLPVSESLKEILRKKKKAAAWFVSNCWTKSNRGDYAAALKNKLKSQYNLDLDIYGKCGTLTCNDKSPIDCDEMVRQDYYFYLAFENSFSEDYVTEKLVRALEFNAIPIVYGGANYSRFLPEGSYLDARDLGVENLAAKMSELINDFDKYMEYFKWTNHYVYHRRQATVETNDYCSMCALLNNESKVKEVSVYKDFITWWNAADTNC